MTILRVEHKKNYTVVNNLIANDKRLSYKAKGIWLYAFSRPDDWEFHISDLINQSTDGEKSVKSGLRELVDAGYLKRDQKKNNDGTFSKMHWVFYEVPQEIKEILPQPQNGPAENRPAVKEALLSTDILPSTELTKPAPLAVSSFSPKIGIDEKLKLLENTNLTNEQKMVFVRNNSAEDLRDATDYLQTLETPPDNTFAYLRSCLKDRYWQNVDPEVQSINKMRKSFVEAINCLIERHPDNVAIFNEGNFYKVGFRCEKGKRREEFELDTLSLKKAKFIANEMNNHLGFNTQIVYNELPGKKIFECLG